MSNAARPMMHEGADDQVLGRELVRSFLLALRTLRTHGPTNQISVAAVRGCMESINRIQEAHGIFEVHVVEDFLYLQEVRLRPDKSDARIFDTLIRELESRGIGSIKSSMDVQEADVRVLLQQMHQASPPIRRPTSVPSESPHGEGPGTGDAHDHVETPGSGMAVALERSLRSQGSPFSVGGRHTVAPNAAGTARPPHAARTFAFGKPHGHADAWSRTESRTEADAESQDPASTVRESESPARDGAESEGSGSQDSGLSTSRFATTDDDSAVSLPAGAVAGGIVRLTMAGEAGDSSSSPGLDSCASPGSSSGTGAATSSDTDRGETATSTDPRSGEAATSSDARGGEADSTSNRFLIDLETEPSGEHPGESTAPSPGPRFHEPVPEFGIAIPKGSILSRRTTSEDAVGTGASSNTQCKRAFFTAVSVYKSMHHGLHIGQPIEIRHAKRTVQNLVDQVLDEEFAILGLTALKTQDNYAFFHSVNVAVLSIALGKRIGLSPQQLVELGTGALFHDIGKVRIPLSILRKPDKLTDEERAIIQLHPQYGVQELLRMGGLDPQLFPALVGCFEHHMCTDAPDESYPQVARYRPHVYGRIISIADCFDALSTRRIYMKSVRSKGQALAWMMEQGGTKFDPVLLKLFVNQVGIHPVGSIVRLKSGRLAVVLRTPEEPGKSHRPVVALVDPATSQADPLPLDLSVRGADGRYLDEVEQTLEADEVGIDLQRLLA